MAEAFNSRSNQIVSDSAAQINAGDDASTIDGPTNSRGPRRRGEDEDGAELFEDDDIESLISQPVNGANGQPRPLQEPEEEVELPSHACA